MSPVLWISLAVLAAILLFETFGTIGLAQFIHVGGVAPDAEIPVDKNELPVGEQAPQFSMTTLSGELITNETLVGTPAALLFVSPDCEDCSVTPLELEALEHKVPGATIVVCRANSLRSAELASELGGNSPVVSDESLSISRLFHVSAPPVAVLLDGDGTIESYGQPRTPEELDLADEAAALAKQSAGTAGPNGDTHVRVITQNGA